VGLRPAADWGNSQKLTLESSGVATHAKRDSSGGERYIVFNVENEMARVIGGVDITASALLAILAIAFSWHPRPHVRRSAVHFLNPTGDVVGVVGGSVTPGSGSANTKCQ